MSAPRPKLDIDRRRERLFALGCAHAAESLETLLTEAVKKPIPAHEFLDQLLGAETSGREGRRVKTTLRRLQGIGFRARSLAPCTRQLRRPQDRCHPPPPGLNPNTGVIPAQKAEP